jgi:hypothetical protein
VLLPMGLFLMWKAATDSQLLDAEAWHKRIDFIRKGVNRLKFRIKNR